MMLTENNYRFTCRNINRWKLLYVLLVVSLVLNGLNIQVVNFMAVCLFFSIVLFAPIKYAKAEFAVVLVFFTYSNIALGFFGFSLSLSTISSMFYLIMLIRIGLHGELKIEKLLFLVLLIVFGCNILINVKVSQFLSFVASMFFVLSLIKNINSDEGNFIDLLCFTLLIAVIGECMYGALFNQNMDTYSWRALQFSGVLDPNDLALHCGLLFVLVYIIGKNNTKYSRSKVLLFVIPIIVLTTLSFSGIVMIIALLMLYFFADNKYFGLIIGLYIVAAIIVYLNTTEIINILMNSRIPFLNGIGQRFNYMSWAYNGKDIVRLTSNRSHLWEQYMKYFNNMGLLSRLFGNASNSEYLITVIGYSSHNFYIDILINYGYVGIFLLGLYIIGTIVSFIVTDRWKIAVVSMIFLIIAFSRTLNIEVLFLYTFLYSSNRSKKLLTEVLGSNCE